GDVGSVAIAFILLFCLGSLILYTNNYIYVLFLTVYGIDAVWTIIRRIYRRENIFQAHRSHLYQFLGNEAGVNKLLISVIYTVLQFGIGYLIIYFSIQDATIQLVFALLVLALMSVMYLILKTY